MTRIRRAVGAAAVAAMTSLIPLTPEVAHSVVPVVDLGNLAYITSAGEVDMVDVMSDGTTSTPTRLGPVTTVQAPKTVEATAMAVSPDGQWLAWSEQIFKPDPKYGPLQVAGKLAVRNMTSGDTVTVNTEDWPLGFAGDTLVVAGSYASRLVMTPSPHLVRIRDGNAYAVATYPHGIVDVRSTVPRSSSTIERDQLRLTTFGGHHTSLHTYNIGLTYRSVAANADLVSADGKKLLVERGNHQDFEGLGPSSLFDTYSLTGGHVRHQLGRYGTNRAKWRLAGATFVGAHDQPWIALHSGYGPKSSGYAVRGVVVAYVGGKWTLKSSTGIAVAGNEAGFAVIQNGTWKPVKNSQDGEYSTHPVGNATLEGPAQSPVPLNGVSATELVWVP